jgi:hypothetical protein
MTLNDLIVGFVKFLILKPMAWAQSDIPIMETPISILIGFVVLHCISFFIIHATITKLFFSIFPKLAFNDSAESALIMSAFIIMAVLSIVIQIELFPTVDTYFLLNS